MEWLCSNWEAHAMCERGCLACYGSCSLTAQHDILSHYWLEDARFACASGDESLLPLRCVSRVSLSSSRKSARTPPILIYGQQTTRLLLPLSTAYIERSGRPARDAWSYPSEATPASSQISPLAPTTRCSLARRRIATFACGTPGPAPPSLSFAGISAP